MSVRTAPSTASAPASPAGSDYGGEVEYLRTFVNQLRKKIELDPSRPALLLTEAWGRYRLHAAG